MSGSQGIARAGNAIVTNAAARGQVLNGIAKAGTVLWTAGAPVPGPVSSYIVSASTPVMANGAITANFTLTVNEGGTVIIVWLSCNYNVTSITGGGLTFTRRAPAAAAAFALYWAYAAASFGTTTFTATTSGTAGVGAATGVIAYALRGLANPASPFDIAAAATGTGNLTITTASPRTLVVGNRSSTTANPPAPPAPFVSAAASYTGAWQRDANTVLTAAGPITMPSGGGNNILDALGLP